MPTYDPEDLIEELRRRAAGFGGRRIVVGIAATLLFIWLWSTWFTVQPEETGIV